MYWLLLTLMTLSQFDAYQIPYTSSFTTFSVAYEDLHHPPPELEELLAFRTALAPGSYYTDKSDNAYLAKLNTTTLVRNFNGDEYQLPRWVVSFPNSKPALRATINVNDSCGLHRHIASNPTHVSKLTAKQAQTLHSHPQHCDGLNAGQLGDNKLLLKAQICINFGIFSFCPFGDSGGGVTAEQLNDFKSKITDQLSTMHEMIDTESKQIVKIMQVMNAYETALRQLEQANKKEFDMIVQSLKEIHMISKTNLNAINHQFAAQGLFSPAIYSIPSDEQLMLRQIRSGDPTLTMNDLYRAELIGTYSMTLGLTDATYSPPSIYTIHLLRIKRVKKPRIALRVMPLTFQTPVGCLQFHLGFDQLTLNPGKLGPEDPILLYHQGITVDNITDDNVMTCDRKAALLLSRKLVVYNPSQPPPLRSDHEQPHPCEMIPAVKVGQTCGLASPAPGVTWNPRAKTLVFKKIPVIFFNNTVTPKFPEPGSYQPPTVPDGVFNITDYVDKMKKQEAEYEKNQDALRRFKFFNAPGWAQAVIMTILGIISLVALFLVCYYLCGRLCVPAGVIAVATKASSTCTCDQEIPKAQCLAAYGTQRNFYLREAPINTNAIVAYELASLVLLSMLTVCGFAIMAVIAYRRFGRVTRKVTINSLSRDNTKTIETNRRITFGRHQHINDLLIVKANKIKRDGKTFYKAEGDITLVKIGDISVFEQTPPYPTAPSVQHSSSPYSHVTFSQQSETSGLLRRSDTLYGSPKDPTTSITR